MRVRNILGIDLRYCQVRNNCRTVYYSEKWPGSDEGLNLLFFHKGSALFQINESRFRVGKNEVVQWVPGDLREFRPTPGSPVSYHALVLAILDKTGLPATVPAIDLPVHFRLPRPGKARDLAHQIHRTFKGKGPFRHQECSTLALNLLRLLWETHIRPDPVAEDEGALIDDRIKDTLHYIAENYKARLDVKFLARRVFLHPVHFTRLFRQATGMAPRVYVLEKKIEKAKDFIGLLGEDPTFTGMELGFHDYSHFSRTFKRISGMTPTEYIKKFRQR